MAKVFWILGPAQTKTGRSLTLEGKTLYVRSACCGQHIELRTGDAAFCSQCDKEEFSFSKFISSLELGYHYLESDKAEDWGPWLEWWFGFDANEAAMEATWADE